MSTILLGDDELEHLILLCETATVARFAKCSVGLRQKLKDPLLIRRLFASRSFPARPSEELPSTPLSKRNRAAQFYFSSTDSIEALAVAEAVRDIGTHHIIFHLASLSIVASSKKLLSSYAALMQRHPKLVMRIDSHTGVGAPRHIADDHSVSRAAVAAKYCVKKGVSASRISACAWGMRVGLACDWPARQEFARVEIALAFRDEAADNDDAAVPLTRLFPTRPSYYDGVAPAEEFVDRSEFSIAEPGGNAGESGEAGTLVPSGSDDDSDDDDGPGGGGGSLLQLLQGLQGLGQNAVVTLPGGQTMSAALLLNMLQQHHGGEMDDDEEGDEDEEDEDGEQNDEDEDDDDDDEAEADNEDDEEMGNAEEDDEEGAFIGPKPLEANASGDDEVADGGSGLEDGAL